MTVSHAPAGIRTLGSGKRQQVVSGNTLDPTAIGAGYRKGKQQQVVGGNTLDPTAIGAGHSYRKGKQQQVVGGRP